MTPRGGTGTNRTEIVIETKMGNTTEIANRQIRLTE